MTPAQFDVALSSDTLFDAQSHPPTQVFLFLLFLHIKTCRLTLTVWLLHLPSVLSLQSLSLCPLTSLSATPSKPLLILSLFCSPSFLWHLCVMWLLRGSREGRDMRCSVLAGEREREWREGGGLASCLPDGCQEAHICLWSRGTQAASKTHTQGNSEGWLGWLSYWKQVA